ncbi:MOSC domain-containing protein [Allokutzneria oryzae]|uniref:MOSC domain-containing protein n=1 Tax=Allokutzneria oryzae TaxID=1378989 RepID=A0ABV5ZTR5_9PSEU
MNSGETTSTRVLSIHSGRPRHFEDPDGRTWYSGIDKAPVTGPVMLRGTGLDGDEQADLRVHGGPDKAACVYPFARYPHWAGQLAVAELAPGAFGENLLVEGVTEDTACIGDVYSLGDAVVQLSQPRSPCWKLARRHRVKDLAVQVQNTGYTGWYLRVLQDGEIAAGQLLTLLERPFADWTVTRANQVRYGGTPAETSALADVPALARSWREKLAELAVKRAARLPESESARLHGESAASTGPGYGNNQGPGIVERGS